LQANYGLHALIVYSDLVVLREFWSFYTKKSIEEKNELVYLAPFYDTVDSVRNILSEGHVSIDVQKYEREEKSLIIVDSLEKYFDGDRIGFDKMSVLKTHQELVGYASELNRKGVSVLGDLGVFLFKNQIPSLMNYELALSSADCDTILKDICLYHQGDFERLSTDQKEKVIKHHKIAMKI
jgi:hypothetical protein